MTVVALVGDCTTTTCMALAAGWPESADTEAVIVEADPTGGSIAAWLDAPLSPSLSSLVTALHHGADSGDGGRSTGWAAIDSMIRRTGAGIRFVPAPFRTREARSALAEADRSLFGLLAATDDVVALVDCGRIDHGRIPIACRHADLTVVCHRLDAASPPAATVRLERLTETVEALRLQGHEIAVVLIGDDPFGLDEVLSFAAPDAPGWQLAVDVLAASVFAGRTGVSTKRLARLPLPRSAARAAVGIIGYLTARTTRLDDRPAAAPEAGRVPAAPLPDRAEVVTR